MRSGSLDCSSKEISAILHKLKRSNVVVRFAVNTVNTLKVCTDPLAGSIGLAFEEPQSAAAFRAKTLFWLLGDRYHYYSVS